jgi:hypothetical protein
VYVHRRAYVYRIMHLWIYLGMYRLVKNFLTYFTKSVHLNVEKDCNILFTYGKRNCSSLFVRWTLSFGSGHQGSRLSQNGDDGSRESFFKFLSTQEHSRLCLCSEVVGPTSAKALR